jgi:hypothetical protein
LVDLSAKDKYNNYHLPQAINLQTVELTPENVKRNQKLVLYSDDNFKSSQAWFLLYTNGYKSVYRLKGGIEAWKNEILFPKIPSDIKPADITKYDKIKEISKFFGGSPIIEGDSAVVVKPQIAMPKLSSPSAAAPVAGGKKPKREGC